MGLSTNLERILENYLAARKGRRVRSNHPLIQEFREATSALSGSSLASHFPSVRFKWSVGKGSWATVPWIAALDSRETTKTSEGVYVIYLFRADMTGLYLTLNQGTSWFMSGYSKGGAEELRHRAALLRQRVPSLANSDFVLDEGVDLRSKRRLVRGYEAATIAFKYYETGAVPPDTDLFADLEALLSSYASVIPTQEMFREES